MDFIVEDVFAQIIKGEAPADIVYEDEYTVAFKDINPKANFHALMVPKVEGLVTGFDVHSENLEIFGRLFLAAKYVSDLEDLDTYKLHMNVGTLGGQVVPRVHLHQLSSDYAPNLDCSAATDTVYYEDETTIAYQHENPVCDQHVVIQLKDPELASGLDVRETNLDEFGNLFWVAKSVSQQLGLEGYKLFMNVAPNETASPFTCFHLLSPDYATEL
jgi:histidine triad (HIT) family protein